MTALPDQFEFKNITKGHSGDDEWKGREADASAYWPEFKFIQLQTHTPVLLGPVLVTRSLEPIENTCSYTSLSLTLCFRFSVYGPCCWATTAKTQIEKCYDDNEPSVLKSPLLVCSTASQKCNPQRGVTGRSCLVLQQERNLNISGPVNIHKGREQQPAFWSQHRIILWT